MVRGIIWLAGRQAPLKLTLVGDCLRDLAGCTLRFANPQAQSDPALAALAADQTGVTGELTASRKVREPAVPHEEMLELLENGEPVPVRLANGLYLEWYSGANGRVVLEATDYTVTLGLPAWHMTAEEHAEQLATSQYHFQRFLDEITGDEPDEPDPAGEAESRGAIDGLYGNDLSHGRRAGAIHPMDPESAAGEPQDGEDDSDDEPLNEFEWEQELREADRRAEAYQEALEKYRDHPQREQMIAAALGWKDEADDPADDAAADALLREALADDSMDIFEGAGGLPAWAGEPGDGSEPGDDGAFGPHHPLSQRAMDFALTLQREAEERGLIDETRGTPEPGPVLALIMHVITVGGKLAGALDGWARGHEPDPGFIIAMLKRAQVPLNEALHAFDGIDAATIDIETRQWLQSRQRDLFDLRREVIDLMHQLRSA